jgi:predicted RNase H-like HicB family nuclease
MFITVLIHHEDGTWWAESPDVSGFSAAADTREQLEDLAMDGLKKFLGEVANMMVAFQMADQVPVAAGAGSTSTATNSVATRLAGDQLTTNTGQGAASLPRPSATNAKVVRSTPELAATA